jgi:hypothetical protein
MQTNGDVLRRHADGIGIPLRTLDDVRETISGAKEAGTDDAVARLLLRHGRITDEARAYLSGEYA